MGAGIDDVSTSLIMTPDPTCKKCGSVMRPWSKAGPVGHTNVSEGKPITAYWCWNCPHTAWFIAEPDRWIELDPGQEAP